MEWSDRPAERLSHLTGQPGCPMKLLRAMNTDSFFGRFDHSLDAKGRVILPARFAGAFTEGAIVTAHVGGCVAVWRPVEFEMLERRMRQESTASLEGLNRARVWASGAFETKTDGQGRIPLPVRLRTFADLAEEVVICGMIDHVELWNPSRWEEIERSQEETLIYGGIQP